MTLTFGIVALGVSDVGRAAEFWSAALGYTLRTDGFGGWANLLVPPAGQGMPIGLQLSETPVQEHPRIHLDLHAADTAEQEAEATRLVSLGAKRVDWDRYPDDPDFIVLEDPDGNASASSTCHTRTPEPRSGSHQSAGMACGHDVIPEHRLPP